MDYVARAREAARRWREANGIPLDADLLSVSALPSPLSNSETPPPSEKKETLSHENVAIKAIEETKEESSRERRGNPPTFCPSVPLNLHTIHEELGARPDPHTLACLRFDVLVAVRQLEREIQTGAIDQRPLLVHGVPLGDWLSLDQVARLLRARR